MKFINTYHACGKNLRRHHTRGKVSKLHHTCGKLHSYRMCGVIIIGSFMSENNKTLHDKLTDESTSFLKILRLAVSKGTLDYWWKRNNPPNESPDVFKVFLKKIKGTILPTWVPRKSEAGPHGLLGEDECFKLEVCIFMLGIRKKYFVKGYFFNKGDRKGVTRQSFREI